ncbi:MAG TPA: DUF4339 domain-containing protein [Tepidisphaeraceae bacterium]|nr:DUF4339 domain-containing protein [Tepidisphaeraceae bacterium]
MAQVAEWYWRRATTEGGPVTWAGLQLLASIGKLGPRDFVRRQSWANWKPACDVDEHDQSIAPPPGDSVASTGDSVAPPPPSPDPPDEPPALGLLSVIGVKPAEPGLLPEAALPPPLPPAAPTAPPPVPASGTERYARRVASARAADAKVAPPPPEPPVYRGAFPFREVVERQRPGTPLNGVAVAAVFASLAGLVVFALPLGAVAAALGGWGMIVAEDNADPRSRRVALMGIFFGAADVIAWLVHAAVHVNAMAA